MLDEYSVADGETWGAFEWLWHNSTKLGYKLRLYEREDVLGPSDFSLYKIREKREDPIARSKRFRPRYDVRLKLVVAT